MILTNSSSAKIGGSNVSAIASATATLRQFMVYTATTISSVISGAIGLVKNGAGTLTLSGNNTYSGGTTVNEGTLNLSGALPSISSITIGSGASFLISAAAYNRLNPLTVIAVNGGTFGNSAAGTGGIASTLFGIINLNSGNITGNGQGDQYGAFSAGGLTINATGVSVITAAIGGNGLILNPIGSSDVLNVSGILKMAGYLTKNGTGTLTLTAANTYSGATTINAGTLTISGTGQLGGGSYAGAIANSGNFIYNSTSNQTLSGVLSGTGALTKNNTGTLTLTAANTYTGGTTVNAGTLKIGNRTNPNANVAGTTTLSGGNLSYDYNGSNNILGNITLTAEATITKLNGLYQVFFGSGTLNGGGQTLNIYVDTTAGTKPIYFSQTAGTSLGQVNILNGAAGEDGAFGTPLRNAPINVASGAQFRTYTSPTINNNITLNGGAGPNGGGALWNESGIASHTPIYTGIITLSTGTNSSFGNTTSGFSITGQITGAGSFTKIGAGTLRTFGNNNNYTGSTTISAGTLRVLKASFGAITPTASFTATTLSVSFSGTFPSGATNFRFFQGTTTNTYAAVTLTGVPVGTTATYTSATSTLTVIVP